ncbi:MAG: serine hydrolase domain-containing protein [Cyclobacteriaceae bacterium]
MQKEKEIVLLKNENDIIPLVGLDTISYSIITLEDSTDRTFQNRCSKYLSPSTIRIDPTTNATHDIDFLSSLIKVDDIVIVTHATENPGREMIDFVRSVNQSHLTVHINFLSHDYILKNPWIAEGAVLIQADDSSAVTRDLAAQLVFGGIGASGKLKEAIGGLYEMGDGFITEKIRLKYTVAEEVGINTDTLQKHVTAILEHGLREKAFPGVQVMAVKGGKIFYHEAFGFHTYDSLRPVRKDDIYDLASVTKTTAATLALMKLHDQNKFLLDIPASTYWPDFKRKDKKDITFRQILSHNARLKSWIPYWTTTTKKSGKYKRKTLSRTPDENYTISLGDSLYLHKDYRNKIYDMIKKAPLNEKEGYVYSGLSFYLYPQIVENISGEPFETFLSKHFYQSLGAETIGFNAGDKFPVERIVPTEIDTFFRMKKLHGEVHDEGAAMMNGISGNAGLFGTAEDLAKIWQMLLNEGQYGGQQYLSAQTINKFTSCQYCEAGNRRGLGFDKPLINFDPLKSSVSELASYRSYGHSGYTGTFVWADPENDFLFIFLSNRVYPTRNNRKIYELNIRPDLHDLFSRLLENQ